MREFVADDASVKPLVEPLLAILATMLSELARLTKQVLDIVRREAVCRRLISVPGVGPITALAFRATIDRPDRFRRSRDVGAHLGLTPARYQSGETDIQGKVSRCGDELARTALYEAAHTLLVRSKKWSSLRAWGMRSPSTARHGTRPRRGCPQTRRHPASHVERSNRVPLRQRAKRWLQPRRGLRRRGANTTNSPERVNRIVPVGTMGQAISLRVQNLRTARPQGRETD